MSTVVDASLVCKLSFTRIAVPPVFMYFSRTSCTVMVRPSAVPVLVGVCDFALSERCAVVGAGVGATVEDVAGAGAGP